MTLYRRFGVDVRLTGWAHSRFGQLVDRDLEDLIVSVGAQAIAGGGLEPGQSDAIFVIT
jgi:acetyl-CoA C-acetyltransferase